MPVAAGTPDPPAIAGPWEEHHENRIRALTAKYASTVVAVAGQKRGGIPSAVQRAATALAVRVLDYRPGSIGRVTVQCPHCGGRRTVQAMNFHTWEKAGGVPACGRGKVPACQPNTEVASDDDEGEGEG